jgi:hypothetical protein
MITTRTKINAVLIILWAIPLFVFVPAKQEIIVSQVKDRIVNVSGIGEVHFPATMSDAEITMAIERDILKNPITLKPDIFDKVVNEKRALSCMFFASNEQIGSYKLNFFCYAPLPIILINGEFAELTIESAEKKYGNYARLNVLNPYWKYWLWMIGIVSLITVYLKRKWFVKLHNLTKVSLLLVLFFFLGCEDSPTTNSGKHDTLFTLTYSAEGFSGYADIVYMIPTDGGKVTFHRKVLPWSVTIDSVKWEQTYSLIVYGSPNDTGYLKSSVSWKGKNYGSGKSFSTQAYNPSAYIESTGKINR